MMSAMVLGIMLIHGGPEYSAGWFWALIPAVVVDLWLRFAQMKRAVSEGIGLKTEAQSLRATLEKGQGQGRSLN